MRVALALLVAVLLAERAGAQAERYEIGLRLKRFEAAWEKHGDAVARERAAAVLPDVTAMFFSLRFGDVAHTLDRARWLLADAKEPPLPRQWVESLSATSTTYLLTGETDLIVTVKPFYRVKTDRPPTATATLRIDGEMPVDVPLASLPARLVLPLPDPWRPREGYELTFTVALDGRPVMVTTQKIPVVIDLAARLARYREAAKRTPRTLETATLEDRVELLTELFDGTVPETMVPAARLCEEADRLCERAAYFSRTRPGQFWLSVPLGKRKVQPVRLFVPAGLKPEKPVPLVVALHGAGGSENLFFEGYGAGYAVRACERRGWLLVAPRSGISFGSGPPVKEIIDALAERYPIDRGRVFLVGHSMGAVQAVTLCQEHPTLFAAAAALGGGGRVKDAKPFAKLPTFVGVGEQDFAREMAKGLAKSLKDGGAGNLTFKKYPNREHLLIVREALPEIFAMWDTLAAGK